MKKTCSKCKQEKALSDFYKSSSGKYGLMAECKKCRNSFYKKYIQANPDKNRNNERKSRLKNEFNLTIEQYDILSIKQNNICAICQKPCSKNKRLSVDHCHKTGEIRGLLCNSCNRGLVHFKDSQENLNNAVSYLNEFIA